MYYLSAMLHSLSASCSCFSPSFSFTMNVRLLHLLHLFYFVVLFFLLFPSFVKHTYICKISLRTDRQADRTRSFAPNIFVPHSDTSSENAPYLSLFTLYHCVPLFHIFNLSFLCIQFIYFSLQLSYERFGSHFIFQYICFNIFCLFSYRNLFIYSHKAKIDRSVM